MQDATARFAAVAAAFCLSTGFLLIAACASRPGVGLMAEGEHMWAHFSETGEIQTAVFEGDLEGVRAPARFLAEHGSSVGLPPSSDTYAEDMRRYAGLAAEASDLSTAALATGQLGSTCGSCHQRYGGGPRFDTAAGPEQGSDYLASHMIRHTWAADRMWEGLVGPSDEAWNAGAAALAGEPLPMEELDVRTDRVDEAKRLAETVHKLGNDARSTTGQADRARLYGQFLATCATCHQAVGR